MYQSLTTGVNEHSAIAKSVAEVSVCVCVSINTIWIPSVFGDVVKSGLLQELAVGSAVTLLPNVAACVVNDCDERPELL